MKTIIKISLAVLLIGMFVGCSTEQLSNSSIKSLGVESKISTPDTFVYNNEHYKKIVFGTTTLQRVDNPYCLDIVPIKSRYVEGNLASKMLSGSLLVTSDVYLQDKMFYEYSQNGINVNLPGKTTDIRFESYLPNDIQNRPYLNLFTIRSVRDNYYIFVRGISGGYHDGVHNNEINVSVGDYSNKLTRTDTTSTTKYEKQNFELITYHRNRPLNIMPQYATGQLTRYQTNPNVNLFMYPNLMGCYAVTQNNSIDFLWLISYNLKTEYPFVNIPVTTTYNQKNEIFNPVYQQVYDTWTTKILTP